MALQCCRVALLCFALLCTSVHASIANSSLRALLQHRFRALPPVFTHVSSSQPESPSMQHLLTQMCEAPRAQQRLAVHDTRALQASYTPHLCVQAALAIVSHPKHTAREHKTALTCAIRYGER
jgi:hypothetical protein